MTRLAARILALLALLLLPATSFADDDEEPSVGAAQVSAVTKDSARISGRVAPGEEKTSWWVEYASGSSTILSTPAVKIKSASDVAVTLTPLAAGTAYSARLVAEAGGERYWGPPVRFTTASAPAPAPAPKPTPSPTPTPTPGSPVPAPAPDAEPPADTPALGESVVVAAEGTVRVRIPGSDAFATLTGAASLPVGSVVDATGGSITLASALAGGGTQDGVFGGGRFAVRQGDRGMVDLHLRGRLNCRVSAQAGVRTLASAAAARRRPKRRLWGDDDGGKFRTHGRDSVATVRGTRWTVTDTCRGTLTTVSEGAVDVKVRRSGRTVRVEAGERHLARHRR